MICIVDDDDRISGGNLTEPPSSAHSRTGRAEYALDSVWTVGWMMFSAMLDITELIGKNDVQQAIVLPPGSYYST